jgi:hypothetical protein
MRKINGVIQRGKPARLQIKKTFPEEPPNADEPQPKGFLIKISPERIDEPYG